MRWVWRIVLILVIAGLGAVGWIVFGPGPLSFAGGNTVALGDYKEPAPTGVPASLAGASLIARGEYLAEAADCAACHTVPGRPRYAGGLAFKLPFGTIYSPNITADKETGIGGWSDADLASYLAYGHARAHGTASGPMGEAVDRSFSQMTVDDIKSIVAYLQTVPAITSPDMPANPAPPAPASHRDGGGERNARGKLVFEGSCASCHGWTGESAVSPLATLTGAAAVNDPAGTNVAQIVLSGTTRLTPDGALSMPSFGHAYSDDEIAAVANYVTARFGAKGASLTARDVSKLREQASQ